MLGKKALVTGASRGLGKALCQLLAGKGVSVIAVARNKELLKQTLGSLPVLNESQRHSILPLDLLNYNELPKYQEHFNDISILVNCAGITSHSLLAKMPVNEIIECITLNLTVPIILSKLACKPMLKIKGQKPVIINISSLLALKEFQVPGTTVYSALKGGLCSFSQALSTETRNKIRVNTILPGLIKETDMGKASRLEITPVSIQKVVEKTVDVIFDESINGQNVLVY